MQGSDRMVIIEKILSKFQQVDENLKLLRQMVTTPVDQ